MNQRVLQHTQCLPEHVELAHADLHSLGNGLGLHTLTAVARSVQPSVLCWMVK